MALLAGPAGSPGDANELNAVTRGSTRHRIAADARRGEIDVQSEYLRTRDPVREDVDGVDEPRSLQDLAEDLARIARFDDAGDPQSIDYGNSLRKHPNSLQTAQVNPCRDCHQLPQRLLLEGAEAQLSQQGLLERSARFVLLIGHGRLPFGALRMVRMRVERRRVKEQTSCRPIGAPSVRRA